MRVKSNLACFPQVWKYDEGETTHIGIGHSASITQAKICPNKQHILSVSTDGAILRWSFPSDL